MSVKKEEAGDFKKALKYAFFLLKYRPRSNAEIVGRLKKKGYLPRQIDKTVNYLQQYKYVNDEEFCEYITASYTEKGWGRRRIEIKLKQLGIPQEFCEKTLDSPAHAVSERENLRKVIEKKLRFYSGKKNVRQKVMRCLLARGFAYDDIIQETGCADDCF